MRRMLVRSGGAIGSHFNFNDKVNKTAGRVLLNFSTIHQPRHPLIADVFRLDAVTRSDVQLGLHFLNHCIFRCCADSINVLDAHAEIRAQSNRDHHTTGPTEYSSKVAVKPLPVGEAA
jgi:hypothetical protein